MLKPISKGGTRMVLNTCVSVSTMSKLKRAKEMGWSIGRIIDYLVQYYWPDESSNRPSFHPKDESIRTTHVFSLQSEKQSLRERSNYD